MRVLRVIARMNPITGGPAQGVRNAISALEKLKVHNEVVSLDDSSAPFLLNDVFKVHALGSGKGMWDYNSKLVPWLVENYERFDVVIVHGLWLYTSYAARRALQLYKKKSIHNAYKSVPKLYVMPHGMLDPYFQQALGRKLKAIRNWFYWKLIEANVVNDANGVLFTCQKELELAREPFWPYRPKKEINVGYGIVAPPSNTDELLRDFWTICPSIKKSPFILFMSRIHPKKGIDLLLNAYANLLKENNDLPILMIAGPGIETAYGQKLKKIVTENPDLISRVFFPGMLSGNAKWGAFYACEAFILPSHQENFGIAVVEALACHKPVLISNQVNIWKEIAANKGGIVDHDTLEGTERLLRTWFLLEKTTRSEMAERAYSTFEKYFEADLVAHNFLQAISAK